MAGTKAGARKALKTRLAKNPNVFSQMGKINPGPGKRFNSKTAADAGKRSKRPKVKPYRATDKPLHVIKLDDVKVSMLEEPTQVNDPQGKPETGVHKPVHSGDK